MFHQYTIHERGYLIERKRSIARDAIGHCEFRPVGVRRDGEGKHARRPHFLERPKSADDAERPHAVPFHHQHNAGVFHRLAVAPVLAPAAAGARLEPQSPRVARISVLAAPPALDPGEVEPAGKNTARQLVRLKEGIATDKGKEIVKLLKESKLKVQASIQDEQLRVTGKNKDDLQSAIRIIRGAQGEVIDLPLQFKNFRD